jgi:hypothetical protein
LKWSIGEVTSFERRVPYWKHDSKREGFWRVSRLGRAGERLGLAPDGEGVRLRPGLEVATLVGLSLLPAAHDGALEFVHVWAAVGRAAERALAEHDDEIPFAHGFLLSLDGAKGSVELRSGPVVGTAVASGVPSRLLYFASTGRGVVQPVAVFAVDKMSGIR